ncbi:MAG: hypothetical protein K2N34_06300 [Lachnospiraceae bacterium]|nr:hypothetical protein [Lachnospiraceae bacterium]
MAVKNSLLDVHNMLLEQMQRLADAETPEEVDSACRVAKSMTDIGKVVVDNAKVVLDAQKVSLEYVGTAPTEGIFAIEHKE